MLGAGGSGQPSVIDLGQLWPCIKHTALTDHSFWKSCAASGHVAGLLQDYKDIAQILCEMASFVFLQHVVFQGQQAKDAKETSASEIKTWLDRADSQHLSKWLDMDLVELVDLRLLSFCRNKQQLLYSSGLGAVLALVQKCNSGSEVKLADAEQKQMLLKIPKNHGLKPAVSAFLEAKPRGVGAQWPKTRVCPLQINAGFLFFYY